MLVPAAFAARMLRKMSCTTSGARASEGASQRNLLRLAGGKRAGRLRRSLAQARKHAVHALHLRAQPRRLSPQLEAAHLQVLAHRERRKYTPPFRHQRDARSEEHTSELQSPYVISYAVF